VVSGSLLVALPGATWRCQGLASALGGAKALDCLVDQPVCETGVRAVKLCMSTTN